jgi:hypothetical protein
MPTAATSIATLIANLKDKPKHLDGKYSGQLPSKNGIATIEFMAGDKALLQGKISGSGEGTYTIDGDEVTFSNPRHRNVMLTLQDDGSLVLHFGGGVIMKKEIPSAAEHGPEPVVNTQVPIDKVPQRHEPSEESPKTPSALAPPIAAQPPVTPPTNEAKVDVGLDPADADIKGLKVNQPLQQFLDAAKKTFATVANDETKPGIIRMSNEDKTQEASAFVDQDGIVYALRYQRRLHGEELGAAIDSLVGKYGKPIADIGPRPANKGFIVRSLHWTKPGILKPAAAGVSADLITSPTSKNDGILIITVIMPGQHTPYKSNDAAGNAPPNATEEKPKPKLDF